MPSFLHYFLRRAGIRIDLLRLRAVYDRHPLPHSIRSLSDTLDELCIPNMICRLEFDQLSELDGPFLVVSGNAEYPFQLVERLDPETRTVRLRTADNRLIDETFDRFRSAWDGSVLTIDRGEAASGLSCPPVAGIRRSDVGLVAGRVCNLSGGLLPFARPHRDVRCGAVACDRSRMHRACGCFCRGDPAGPAFSRPCGPGCGDRPAAESP